MAVDREMEQFLDKLDGTRALGQATAEFIGQQRSLHRLAKSLLKTGVLVDQATNRVSPNKRQARRLIETVSINLTGRCNYHCVHCYNKNRPASRPKDELTADEFCGFLRDIRPIVASTASLVICGGEPLLECGKLIRLADQARLLGWPALVSTNGSLRACPWLAC